MSREDMSCPRARAHSPLRRFSRAERASALVEFALLTPLAMAMVMLVGFAAVGLDALTKVGQVARTVSNFVSVQTNGAYTGQVGCLLNTGALIMAPWNPSTLVVTVSAVLMDGPFRGSVQWSQSTSGPGRTVGSKVPITVMARNVPYGTTWILTEVTYQLSTPFTTLTVPLTANNVMPVRNAT